MTQEEKDLLLKDLCARLPYGVKVQHQHQEYLNEVQTIEIISKKYGEIETESVLGFVDDFKPYLFPLSSMTEEQEKEYLNTCNGYCTYYWTDETFDWLNKNHFDYRGLIKKSLAIDATNLNIYD
jgi:hypothetical protein